MVILNVYRLLMKSPSVVLYNHTRLRVVCGMYDTTRIPQKYFPQTRSGKRIA